MVAMRLRSTGLIAAAVVGLAIPLFAFPPPVSQTTPTTWMSVWGGYGGNAQHTAIASDASQPLNRILWSTPVDLQPQYSGSDLFIHYGSPVITPTGTIIVPVKTGATGGFRFDARRVSNGGLLWTQTTDYVLPPQNWTPSCSPTLMGLNWLAMPGAGGTLIIRTNTDKPTARMRRSAFYGDTVYAGNEAFYNDTVKICTPLTSDRSGNVYFGFRVYANGGARPAEPLGLVSGFAKVTPDGKGSWIAASDIAGDSSMNQPVMNCAPAVTADGRTVYVVVSRGSWNMGRLVALNASNLTPINYTDLTDPISGDPSLLPDEGTASPMIGPDGDVYFGVLENPFPENHDRGWMLHFDGSLTVEKPTGAFGWDDTASVVPSSAVPSYEGSSSYLLLTKYNNYAGVGGDGVNRVAILDPNDTAFEPISGFNAMKEVISIAGPSSDPSFPGLPNAVREWCINSAAVDVAHKCAIINNEDGKCYRWDFTSNTLSQTLVLTSGIGEAYTPTLIAHGGVSFAINNATLFALGK